MQKEQKFKLLQSIEDNDKKILVSNILEKAEKYKNTGKFLYTNFLDLNELSLAKKYLDYFKYNYEILDINKNCEKKIISFVPNYITKEMKYSMLRCIKVIPKSKGVLLHKDYMGSIYNLGIQREFLGDIFVTYNYGLVICFKNIADYISLNLTRVKNEPVQVEIFDIFSSNIVDFKPEFIYKKVISNSLRVDIILSKIYKLSREQVKNKIEKGDLFINSKQIYSKSLTLAEGDIVSFRKCGKFRTGQVLGKTRSDNFVLQVDLYK